VLRRLPERFPPYLRKRSARLATGVISLCMGGFVALFLVAASPDEGEASTTLGKWVLILIAVVGFMAVGIAAGQATRGAVRASFFGLAAGTAFGLLAALTKETTGLVGDGAAAFFTTWQPYALLAVGIAGMIVQQSAFQAAPLQSSLPVMDSLEPTVAVLIGVFAFGEHLSTSVGSLAAEAAGIAAVLTGVVLLDRSPLVLDLQRGGGQPDSHGRSDEPIVSGGSGTSRS
jgi:hypothetical protein